jgi:hypothetical protein
MRNVSDKSCRQNRNTHFMFSNFFCFRKSCRLLDNVERTVERSRSQMTIWRMRIALWIPKATNTHTHKLYNAHCFYSTRTVARMRVNVTWYLHCLLCNVLQTSLVTGCKASKRITMGIFIFTTCIWKLRSTFIILWVFRVLSSEKGHPKHSEHPIDR